MKKFIVLIIVFLTGCTITNCVGNNYITIVNDIIKSDSNIINTTTIGYKYYIPKGVTLLFDNDFNQKFRVKDTFMYLYTDITSYYYKNNTNYNEVDKNNCYYYQDIINDDLKGYIKIKEENNQFYVEIIYNYAKIEMYSSKYYLKENIAYATIIVSSIEYNDSSIEKLINKNYFSSYEHKYVLDKPTDSNSNFLEYSEEYNTYEDDALPDDKSINMQEDN